MRSFGRQCRGQGQVFVKLVRYTEQQLLQLGEPIAVLGQQAQHLLAQATALSDATRERFAEAFNAAMHSHAHIRQQSTRLTQGKKLRHCKLVNAYDLTIAPILKGKSNCPAQFGRKPGIVSDPATGCLFATRVPEGNPSDPSYVLPSLTKSKRRLNASSHHNALGFTRWPGIWALMTRHCVRRSTHGVSSQWASPRWSSLSHPIRVLSRCSPSSKRQAYTVSARLIKSTWPVRVALAVRWWKAISPACCRAGLARCGTKVIQGPWYNWA